MAACAVVLSSAAPPAHGFTVSGVSFSDFRKSADSCYRCGDRDDDGAAPARPDPREVERQDLITQANYAWAREDRETALQYALKALAIRDDPGLREWVRQAQSLTLVDRANALAQAGDHHGALAVYRQALALWPGALTDKAEFERYETAVARRDQIEAEQRAEVERRDAMMRGWRDADAQALDDMRRGNWRDAVSAYERARVDGMAASDSTIGIPAGLANDILANRAVAIAGLARSQGNLDEALRGLQTALSFDPSNRMANALLSAAYAERERTRAAMQAAAARLQPVIDDGAVYAGGPKTLAQLNATIPEIANSPQAERARKGLVAAANHDWKVALAWYQDALNRDPGNAALIRAVDLAQWMVNAKPAAGPLTQPPKLAAAERDDGIDYDEKILALIYRELADGFARAKFTDDRDKAKADYFASEFRKQAVEAEMFADATKRAQDRPSLPLK